MGYREDGFFNIDWAQDTRGAKPSGGGKENPPFMFPDKNIRFLDAQSELQRKFNSFADTISRGDYKIHRGYIRNLEQPQFGNVPISRCNFQFNPQEIRQNVAMREDLYLPLLQDVAQLSQPIGAVVNFTFDLLFDRSHELSKGRKTGESWLDYSQSSEENVDPLNPNPDKDAYDIGVMADLRILYSVIGQGFSREMLEFQKKTLVSGAERILGNQIDAETSTEDGATTEGTETSSSTTSSTLGEVDDAALNDILEANYGNWGLLMPNPVRVMFSSLFMLDGFITGTNVDFLKFNTKMVPLMCRVTMNMSAMYIGFARQDTFLTKTFKDAAESIRQEREQNEATRAEIVKALQITAKKFVISSAWDEKGTTSWDDSAREAENKLPVWTLVVADNVASKNNISGRALFLGFPNVVPKEGGFDETLPDGTIVRRGADVDSILRLYEEGSTFTVSYTWSINVYGKITSPGLTKAEADALLANKSYTSSNTTRLIGTYSGTESCTSKDGWGSGTSGSGAAAERVRRRSIRGGASNSGLPNEAISSIAIHKNIGSYADVESGSFSWLKNAYYIVDFDFDISVSYGSSSDEVSIKKTYSDVLSGTSNFRKLMILNWESNGADVSDNPNVNPNIR
jgi:hypothetical protein